MGIKHRTAPPHWAVGDSGRAQWSEDHVVDSGGITFADNTVQTTAAGAGGGSVTSVGYSAGSGNIVFGGTATPITTSGAFTVDLSSGAKTSLGLANTALQPIGSLNGSYTYASLTINTNGQITAVSSGATPPVGANPTASVALAAVNGSAATFMRSDGAPALDVTIAPTWTGHHTFSPDTLTIFNGAANTETIRVVGNVTSGQSRGILIESGTTSADYAIAVLDHAAGVTFFECFGDGHGTLGASATLGLQWTSTGLMTCSTSLVAGVPTGGAKGTGTVNATGLYTSGAAVSPSAQEVPVALVSGQRLFQYQQALLAGTDRLTMAGTSRMIVTRTNTDYQPGPQGEAFESSGQVVLGQPKRPNVNFVVPTDYICPFLIRLTLPGGIRANLIGTATVDVFDDSSGRARITLAGRGY